MTYFRIESPVGGRTTLALADPKLKPDRQASGVFQVPSGFDPEKAGLFIHSTLESQVVSDPLSTVFIYRDGHNLATYWIEPNHCELPGPTAV